MAPGEAPFELVKSVGGTPIYLRDVATVQDASDIPAGYALARFRSRP
jgi:Cu/Ag efflux pump CusA